MQEGLTAGEAQAFFQFHDGDHLQLLHKSMQLHGHQNLLCLLTAPEQMEGQIFLQAVAF